MIAFNTPGPPPPPGSAVEQASRSKINLGSGERIVSMLGGGTLMATGLWYATRRDAPAGLLLTALGGLFTWRGASGRCPVCAALGVTAEDATPLSHPLNRRIEATQRITIDRSPTEVYAFWRDLNNMPALMPRVESVEVYDERHARWRVRGPRHRVVEWESEIVEDRPGEHIAWRSADQRRGYHGEVSFEPAPDGRGTVVCLKLAFRPRAGVVGAAVGRILGRGPKRAMRGVLRQLKEQLEGGGPARGERFETGRAAQGPAQAAGARIDRIDEAVQESFPASDAPSWTPVR